MKRKTSWGSVEVQSPLLVGSVVPRVEWVKVARAFSGRTLMVAW